MDQEDRIDRYLRKIMSEEEHRKFEEDLLADKQLSKKVEEHKMVKKISRNIPYMEAEEILERFDAQLKRKRRLWTFLPAPAAVILLLFLAGSNLWERMNSNYRHNLIVDHMIAQDLMTTRSAEPSKKDFEMALDLFERNRFEESNRLLNDLGLHSTEANNLRIRNYIKLRQYLEALELLDLIKEKDIETSYLQALAFIGIKENIKAKGILESLENSGNEEIKMNAADLLEALK